MHRTGFIIGVLLAIFGVGSLIAAIITHIVVCIKDESYILLLCGIFAFPVGIVHGFGQWFGVW